VSEEQHLCRVADDAPRTSVPICSEELHRILADAECGDDDGDDVFFILTYVCTYLRKYLLLLGLRVFFCF
jgi:hypothetical protein